MGFYRQISRFFALTDAFFLAAAFQMAYQFRFSERWLLRFPTEHIPEIRDYRGILIFLVIVGLSLLKLFGAYDRPRFSTLFDECARIAGVSLIGALLFFGLLFLYRELWVSRQVIVIGWLFFVVSATAMRMGAALISGMFLRMGKGRRRVLLIGLSDDVAHLAKRFQKHPASDVDVVATLPVERISEARPLIRSHEIEEVIVASPTLSPETIIDVITECEMEGILFRIVPGRLEMLATRLSFDEVGGLPLLSIAEIRLQGLQALTKRTMDLMVSAILLVLISPLLLLIAILITIDSKGPVFFKQVRVTRDQKLFVMLKFRTMRRDAEQMLSKLATRGETSEGKLFKIKDDPRITRVGKWLRRLSIDELPQLINVLRGDMSLIGPRPPLPREVRKYTEWEKKRLRVRCGITGLWQVSGRSELSFDEMVRLDIYYIENWSLWQDCKLILLTVPAVLKAKGAY